jgi:hypothetical protein
MANIIKKYLGLANNSWVSFISGRQIKGSFSALLSTHWHLYAKAMHPQFCQPGMATQKPSGPGVTHI